MRSMRVVIVLIAAAALAAAATAGTTLTSGGVLGVRWSSNGSVAQHYDAVTLRPTGTGRLVPLAVWQWSYQPGRQRVALVGDRPGKGPEVLLLDARTMGTLGSLSVSLDMHAPTSLVHGVSWVRAGRLLVVTSNEGSVRVHLVDPSGPSSVGSTALKGMLVAGAATARGLVLLLAPADGIGPARLVTVDADLRTTAVVLDGIRAGTAVPPAGTAPEDYEPVTRIPALAVDPVGRRAVVVGYAEPIADVDLETGTVSYHAAPVRLPTRSAKSLDGPVLSGFWLDGKAIAVTGTLYGGRDTNNELRQKPFGLQLLDLTTWRARIADPDLQWLSKTGPYLTWMKPEAGFSWYTHGGRRVGWLFRRRQVADLSTVRTRALVRLLGESQASLVDLRTGRIVERRTLAWPALPLFLVADSAPMFG